MGTVRAHVILPEELAREIDKLAGPRGRSAFLVETAEKEVRRRKLLAFLESDTPAWKPEDHPDIEAIGAAAWVRQLRRQQSPRQKRLERLSKERKA
ncbi:MAG TPA: hypothetical protein VF392_07970 [Terracidiphilus sp.]